MCFTMVNPAISVLEVKEIPTVVYVDKTGTTNEIFDSIYTYITRLV